MIELWQWLSDLIRHQLTEVVHGYVSVLERPSAGSQAASLVGVVFQFQGRSWSSWCGATLNLGAGRVQTLVREGQSVGQAAQFCLGRPAIHRCPARHRPAGPSITRPKSCCPSCSLRPRLDGSGERGFSVASRKPATWLIIFALGIGG
jgi:hypothetical protein